MFRSQPGVYIQAKFNLQLINDGSDTTRNEKYVFKTC